RDMVARHGVARNLIVTKMLRRHEPEAVPAEPKMPVWRTRPAMEAQLSRDGKAGARRQGRPAAVIIGIAPAHPRWRPHIIRTPTPAQPGVPEPAAIMKCGPAPRVIRFPVPSAVTINPAPAVKVRLPIAINFANSGLPAAAIAI